MILLRRTFKIVLDFLNVVFIYALLLSTMANYVKPNVLDLLALVGLGYLPLLLITSLFLLRRNSYRSKLFWLTVISVIYSLLFIGRFIQLSLPGTRPVNSIRLITYNAHSFDLNNKDKNSKNGAQIFAFLKQQSPDIICIQEYTSSPKRKLQPFLEFTQNLGYNYFYPLYNLKYQTYGNAIISRYPILAPEIQLKYNDINFEQIVDLRVGKDTIRLINNHLKSVQLSSMDTSMEFGIQQIDSVTKKLKNAFVARTNQANWLAYEAEHTNKPLIVCGDFNDTPISYTYHHVGHRLYDAFMEKGNGLGVSFWLKFIPLRIDYFLHNDKIVVHSYHCPNIKYSDHFPVIVDFSIKKH